MNSKLIDNALKQATPLTADGKQFVPETPAGYLHWMIVHAGMKFMNEGYGTALEVCNDPDDQQAFLKSYQTATLDHVEHLVRIIVAEPESLVEYYENYKETISASVSKSLSQPDAEDL